MAPSQGSPPVREVAIRVKAGGTANPAAFDAYPPASKARLADQRERRIQVLSLSSAQLDDAPGAMRAWLENSKPTLPGQRWPPYSYFGMDSIAAGLRSEGKQCGCSNPAGGMPLAA